MNTPLAITQLQVSLQYLNYNTSNITIFKYNDSTGIMLKRQANALARAEHLALANFLSSMFGAYLKTNYEYRWNVDNATVIDLVLKKELCSIFFLVYKNLALETEADLQFIETKLVGLVSMLLNAQEVNFVPDAEFFCKVFRLPSITK